jgi:hypothetical protein
VSGHDHVLPEETVVGIERYDRAARLRIEHLLDDGEAIGIQLCFDMAPYDLGERVLSRVAIPREGSVFAHGLASRARRTRLRSTPPR